MPDPLLVDVVGNDFTKVATAVKFGQIHIKDSHPHYVYTYRDAGTAAPTYPDDLPECVDFDCDSLPISASVLIDVYVATAKDDGGGKVRVDL